MIRQVCRILPVALAAILLFSAPVEASSHVAGTEGSLEHGIWLPLSLILTLAALTAPAVLPKTGRREGR